MRQLEQRVQDEPSRNYDRDLLSKIGGPNTPQRLSISSYTSSNEGPSNSIAPELSEGRSTYTNRLSVQERRHTSNDTHQPSIDMRHGSVGGIPTIASASANSPGPFRSPIFEHPDFSRSTAQRHPSLTYDDSASHRANHDSVMIFSDEDSSMDDGPHDKTFGGPDDLQLGTHAGMKRRASSPPRETTREERSSVGSAAGTTDLYHRRSMQQLPNRNSPAPRCRQLHYGSVSSVSSAGHRTGSLGSSLGLSIASSVTSLASGRISPSNLSPNIDPELTGPFFTSRSLDPSPRASLSYSSEPRKFSEIMQDQMQLSPEEISPQHADTSQLPTASRSGKIQCECCPKKPKKFDTAEELRYVTPVFFRLCSLAGVDVRQGSSYGKTILLRVLSQSIQE